jgi:prepilin-type processing-associated H-X9-DG protein
MSLAAINSPSVTLLLAEQPIPGTVAGGTGNVTGYSSFANVDSPNSQAYPAANRGVDPGRQPYHNGGWNYAFCDGHVKFMKPENTIRTAGITYPVTLSNGTVCQGTVASPCGMWTIDEND